MDNHTGNQQRQQAEQRDKRPRKKRRERFHQELQARNRAQKSKGFAPNNDHSNAIRGYN